MDTKKLRQKILDLAIHGKLVPQDPNDEPASVLLERIRAEKERLIAEGKIKRSKKSATSDTSHYENVPEGWCITTIGEVFNLQAGKNISANDIHEFSREFPYACYGGNGIRGYVSDYNKEGRFPIIGRQGALCGNVNFAEGKFYATEHAVVVTCIAGVNVEWARYVLEAMNLNQYATATAQPGLSVATVNEVEFLLPPLKEQCRIAEFVANCFDAIESLTSQTNNLRLNLERAKSKILDLAIHGKLVLQDANDEPASELLKRINPKAVASCDNPHYENVPFVIPSSWAWCKVRDVADVARGGSPRPIKQYLTESPDGVNWIKIGDAEEGSKYISKTTERIIPDGVKKSRYVKVGDFLLTNSMSFGKPFILKTNGCIHDGWLVISPIDGAYDKNFLYYLLSSSFAYNQFSEKAGGAVVSNLNKDKVADSLFPLPPLAEQKRIASMVEELYSSLEGIASTLQ